ncbi:gephyrin-like molybdotransferase Glp [Nocardioides sp. TF02-7]|uniref:molybdopterin molybdotransferase MoeA n=1 Tax=Nocardioides sp. TF02-7 TaxID=2917724 RepID=UPI001F0520E3|nr:gephyrin-like molybdotransferase Glp [Nocardioides sp. TF02-7]UMG93726.1 molybdopterin molybdotransferase MoeA [Nocardioides sp. TF02-7]
MPLPDALGLVCATTVHAAVPVPRFDHAAMDGYAVRAADVAAAGDGAPVELPVVGAVAAGDAAVPALAAGTAVRIMTGAPVPDGADTVVPFEWTDERTGRTGPVRVLRAAPAGRHVRRAGEDVAGGTAVAAAGAVLGPHHLGLLAAAGLPDVPVHPAPRVAVLATGAELVGAGAQLDDLPGQVVDSNTVALVAAVRRAGARAVLPGPAPDDTDLFLDRLQRAADAADLVVTTGGISAGDHDVVKAALGGRDEFWFGPVAVRPGRPQGCGAVRSGDGRTVPVVALPGTPVAAFTSWCLFALPAVRRLAGRPAGVARRLPLGVPVTAGPDRTSVLPATVDRATGTVAPAGRRTDGAAGGPQRMTSADPAPGAGHSLRMLAAADALLLVPPQGRLLPAGTDVEVIPLEPEDR